VIGNPLLVAHRNEDREADGCGIEKILKSVAAATEQPVGAENRMAHRVRHENQRSQKQIESRRGYHRHISRRCRRILVVLETAIE